VKVSFIIPLYNGLPLTQAMLASLRATLPAGLPHEIILVDDGSTDGTREWLAGLDQPRVSQSNPSSSSACRVLLNERNRGFAVTCNRGATSATGEFLFFLNNDLVLLPGWLEPMLAALERLPRPGLVGNVQLQHATGNVDHAGIGFDPKGKPVHLTHRGWSAWRRCDAVTGACFAIRRALWSQLGGFDEGYMNGGEDVDLAFRAQEAGCTNGVALRSVVRHHVSASLGRKLRDEQNTRRLFRRWRVQIADRITRHCARDCLLASWDEPRDYPDPTLARHAALHWLGVLPQATHRLKQASLARLDYEEQRWAHLLDGAPLRPEREVSWQFYPPKPERKAVI
jgi:GT2 family glycosyltransferase